MCQGGRLGVLHRYLGIVLERVQSLAAIDLRCKLARFRPCTAHLYVASASDAIRHLRQGRGEGGFGEVATRAFCSPLHVLAERSEELATSARRR
jgi:hypothetical protein